MHREGMTLGTSATKLRKSQQLKKKEIGKQCSRKYENTVSQTALHVIRYAVNKVNQFLLNYTKRKRTNNKNHYL